MTKRVRPERRLIITSTRRPVSEDGLARLVAAMVLHQLDQQRAEEIDAGDEETSA
ncbi:hypothetical protein [Marmoricola sp. URHB0036]|uniref:hypothetical protein n=1 Tax=Marmoricola sp. URHB0036 TaxID=1298863 RepID=UPI00040C7488|nr:hypothetical protein [Marmoricola sp. URHB0036]